MTKPNILYLFETAVGLGHQRRASGIVNGMVAAGFNVTVASGSFVDREDFFTAGVDFLELSANRRRKNGITCYYDDNHALVRDPHHDFDSWNQERIAAISSYAAAKPIDVVMAEWWPFNRRKEFGGIIDATINVQERNFGHRPLIISSARDILKSGDDFATRKENRVAVDLINTKVDAIFMHSDAALIPLEEVFMAHAEIQKPVFYTGYVVNDGAKTAGPRNGKIVVSCGSGDEGHHLLKAAFKALPFSERLRGHECHFVLGPRMEAEHRGEFRDIAQRVNGRLKDSGLTVTIHDQLPELPRVLAEAGFSISLAGYNTTMEVLASGVPAVLVPKFIQSGQGKLKKVEIEQWKRLVRLQKQGMATIANPVRVLSPANFAGIMDSAHAKGTTKARLNMNGAGNTAEIIAGLLESPEATISAGLSAQRSWTVKLPLSTAEAA